MITKNIENLFIKAIDNNMIFEFLIGREGYEIRIEFVNMPTDIDMATFLIAKYLKSNPNYDVNLLIDEFIKISNSIEWSWLIVYYVSEFKKNNLLFLPINLLYNNLSLNKNELKLNQKWLCYNFKPKFNNLWDIIVNENNRVKDKYDLPLLV